MHLKNTIQLTWLGQWTLSVRALFRLVVASQTNDGIRRPIRNSIVPTGTVSNANAFDTAFRPLRPFRPNLHNSYTHTTIEV